MRVDYQKAYQKCKKCPKFSEKPEFGKCLATRSDILKCAEKEWLHLICTIEALQQENEQLKADIREKDNEIDVLKCYKCGKEFDKNMEISNISGNLI